MTRSIIRSLVIGATLAAMLQIAPVYPQQAGKVVWPPETSLKRGWGDTRIPRALRAEIDKQNLTAEELRNVQVVLDRMAGLYRTGKGPDLSMSPTYKRPPGQKAGFYILHEAFGYPAKNGYSEPNFADRINHLESVVAKGNRVVILWTITGTINGPMYGFAGKGQKIRMREMMDFQFTPDGKVERFQPWASEDLAFYQQLGGPAAFDPAKAAPPPGDIR